MTTDRKIEDVKFALVAIDPDQEGDLKTVLHFCVYFEQPTFEDMMALKQELLSNPDFGLIEIGQRLEIIQAPDSMVEEFLRETAKFKGGDSGIIY